MKHLSSIFLNSLLFALCFPLALSLSNRLSAHPIEEALRELIREELALQGSQEPGAESQEPGAPSEEPGAESQEPGAPSEEEEPEPGLPNNRLEITDVGYRHISLAWTEEEAWQHPFLIQRSQTGAFADPVKLENNQGLGTFRWLGINATRYTDLDDLQEATRYVYRVAAVTNLEAVRLSGAAPEFSEWLYGEATTGTLDPAKKQVYDIAGYGAVPNDGKNDYPAIQKAFEAAQAAGGGVIYSGPGQWDLWPNGPTSNLFTVTADNITFQGRDASWMLWLSGKRPATEWDLVDGTPRRYFLFLTGDCEDFSLVDMDIDGNAPPVNTGKEWYSAQDKQTQWDTSHKLLASFANTQGGPRNFDRVLIDGLTTRNWRGEVIYNGGGSGKILIKDSSFDATNSSTISGTFDLELVNTRIADSANAAVESMIENGRNHIARGCAFIGLDTLKDVPGKKNFGGWLVFNEEGTYQSVTDCTFRQFVKVAFGPWYECRNGFRFNTTFGGLVPYQPGNLIYTWTSRQTQYKLDGGFSEVLWLGDTIEIDRDWPNYQVVFYSQPQGGQAETPWRWVDVHLKNTGGGSYKVNRLCQDVGGARPDRSGTVFAHWRADAGIRFDPLYIKFLEGSQPELIDFLK